jgi:hypothetical protein
MIDLQLIFILCAVVLVLVLARYLQMFFEELTKEKKIKILKQKLKKDKSVSKNGEENLDEVADLSSKDFKNLPINESSSLERDLGSTLSFALLHILKNIVALEVQHKKLVDTGIFDKKLHSSNLISRVKIDYELINNDLRDITNQEAGMNLAKDFQIMVEHVKYIDFTFINFTIDK